MTMTFADSLAFFFFAGWALLSWQAFKLWRAAHRQRCEDESFTDDMIARYYADRARRDRIGRFVPKE
jgi:hypothetical protein